MEDIEAPLCYKKQLCQLYYMKETLSWVFQNEIFQACQSQIYLLFILFEFQEESETPLHTSPLPQKNPNQNPSPNVKNY